MVSAESMIFANYIALYRTWAICEYSLNGLLGFLSNALIKLHRKPYSAQADGPSAAREALCQSLP